jgi:RNA polymerase sigma factor (TIGR02999 family)
MTDVTRILSAIEQGDPRAAEQLFPLVYDELRKLAARKMAGEKPGQTLDATALVHEVYLRMVDVNEAGRWQSRGHFFRVAADVMRHILVDRARRRQSQKRGGTRKRVALDEASFTGAKESEVLAVSEALTALAAVDPKAAELVKLRYFVGLSIPDAAEVLNIGARSADRLWAYARAWLSRAMREP